MELFCPGLRWAACSLARTHAHTHAQLESLAPPKKPEFASTPTLRHESFFLNLPSHWVRGKAVWQQQQQMFFLALSEKVVPTAESGPTEACHCPEISTDADRGGLVWQRAREGSYRACSIARTISKPRVPPLCQPAQTTKREGGQLLSTRDRFSGAAQRCRQRAPPS